MVPSICPNDSSKLTPAACMSCKGRHQTIHVEDTIHLRLTAVVLLTTENSWHLLRCRCWKPARSQRIACSAVEFQKATLRRLRCQRTFLCHLSCVGTQLHQSRPDVLVAGGPQTVWQCRLLHPSLHAGCMAHQLRFGDGRHQWQACKRHTHHG